VQRAPLYGEDLAYIHEQGFGWYALRSGPGLLALLRNHGVDQGLVVDLGCGPGAWQRHLVSAGFEALGVDASPAMVELARQTAPKARFIAADLKKAVLPRCAAVTSIGEVLSYALHTDRQVVNLFRRVYKALEPNGLFIFDIGTDGRLPGGTPLQGHWKGDDWVTLLDAEYDEPSRMLTRHLTSFRKHGSGYRRSEETHRLRLFDAGFIAAELAQAGFHTKRLKGFGLVRFQSGHAGFLARKPG
jgi:SAM-dependent methyltransferase